MFSTTDHYETLLADSYDWMQGGWSVRADDARSVLSGLDLQPVEPGDLAVDLGAGTGYQTIPLAEMGYEVLAIDSSPAMLSQLGDRIGALPITTATAEVARIADLIDRAPQLVVCMGDTLPHLASHDDVRSLLGSVFACLAPGGRLVLSYRSGESIPSGNQRFLAIRSDPDRIFTCFLEEIDDATTRVHDILHVRAGVGFEQRVSSYTKIRLRPPWVDQVLAETGFLTLQRSIAGGLITQCMTKP